MGRLFVLESTVYKEESKCIFVCSIYKNWKTNLRPMATILVLENARYGIQLYIYTWSVLQTNEYKTD